MKTRRTDVDDLGRLATLVVTVALAGAACTVANSEAGDAGAGGDTLRIVLA